MLLIVGLGLFINNAWSAGTVLGSTSNFDSGTLLAQTNAERAKRHESSLTLDSRLSEAAQAKAEDMAQKNYWSHDAPDGKTPWAFIDASGYQYQSAGENLAYGFADATDSVAGWMGSQEHRDNILNRTYQNVGFGVATSPDYLGHGPETIVVAEYAQPTEVAAGAPSQSHVLGAATEATPVSRIQLLTGSEWTVVAAITLSGGAMAIFLLRHGYRWHRWLNRGEAFVLQHTFFDIAIVFLITAGGILTRTSGIIR